MAIRLSNYVSDGNNYRQVNAGGDPTSNDDGYKVGTHWYNTGNGNLWVCGKNDFQDAKWNQFGLTVDEMVYVDMDTLAVITLDCSEADNFIMNNADQVYTITLDNFTVGRTVSVHFNNNDGAFAVTWPTDVYWAAGGTAPTLTASGRDTVVLTRIASDRVHANAALNFQTV